MTWTCSGDEDRVVAAFDGYPGVGVKWSTSDATLLGGPGPTVLVCPSVSVFNLSPLTINNVNICQDRRQDSRYVLVCLLVHKGPPFLSRPTTSPSGTTDRGGGLTRG